MHGVGWWHPAVTRRVNIGVHSGMSSRDAFKLCPHAISVRGNHHLYSEASREVTEIIDEMVPLYQKASVDEFYIDLTGTDRFFDPYKLASQVTATHHQGNRATYLIWTGIGQNRG